MIIGICGKSGSGKSTLANKIIKKYDNGAVHLDIDKIGHKVLTINEVKNELITYFSKTIIVEDEIDRKSLSNKVFASKKDMDKLTEITWSYMEKEIDNFLENNVEKVVILDWLLLPKSKYFNICDAKILLDIPYEVRKERAMKRDNISAKAFELRDKSGIEFNDKDFNYVLYDTDDESIKRMVELL